MAKRKAENIKLTLPVSKSRDHIQGPVTAPITLVEYGDYECSYCAQAYMITNRSLKLLLLSFDTNFVTLTTTSLPLLSSAFNCYHCTVFELRTGVPIVSYMY
jgi:hypothetical protein